MLNFGLTNMNLSDCKMNDEVISILGCAFKKKKLTGFLCLDHPYFIMQFVGKQHHREFELVW